MESNMRTVISMLVILAVGVSIAAAQQVKKESVPGINNFAKVESTVACAGAITPAAVADIKKMGYAAIINLREASEPGADVEAEAAAAKAAQIRYFHVPFNGGKPETAPLRSVLKAITAPRVEAGVSQWAGGKRAASMWFIKRALIDKW